MTKEPREQLELFHAIPGKFAARDAQDLMAYPFFSLSKGRRTSPIAYETKAVAIRVEGVPEHGIATIWDADILIFAASQVVEARDRARRGIGCGPSRLLAVRPHEILRFVGRGASSRDYVRLRAALDRLQATTVSTTIRAPNRAHRHRFSWINEWKEATDSSGGVAGMELVLPDWFYQGVLDNRLVLTIDPAYFRLTGGLERWLYRLARKHGGRQPDGWSFDLKHLHVKSGSLMGFRRFRYEISALAARNVLPGYELEMALEITGRDVREVLDLRPRVARQSKGVGGPACLS